MRISLLKIIMKLHIYSKKTHNIKKKKKGKRKTGIIRYRVGVVQLSLLGDNLKVAKPLQSLALILFIYLTIFIYHFLNLKDLFVNTTN